MFRIEILASTTPLPEPGCPVRLPGKVHLEILRAERFRRISGHGVSRMQVVASTTLIAEFA